MKTLNKHTRLRRARLAVAAGCALAVIPMVGASGTGSVASADDEEIDGGIFLSSDLPPELQPGFSATYDPGPGKGYSILLAVPASYLPWEIKLTPEAERAGLRSAAQAAAKDFTNASGVQMTVAAGTVPSSYTPKGEEVLINSSTLHYGDDCNPDFAWTGCGGPTSLAKNDLGVTWIDGGKITIHTRANGRGTDYLREIISHEVGHVVGLGHYDATFEGRYQVMKQSGRVGPGYKSGDRNGLINAVSRSKTATLDSSIPGFVIAAGESLDFDRDGKSDVFGRDAAGGWRYSSGGVRSWRGLSSSVAEYRDLRFGDFDGDGKTDVFTAVWTGRTYQWKYRSGGVGEWRNIGNAPIALDQLRFGDFDGDAKTDVFMIQKEGSSYRWKYSSGGASGWRNLAISGVPLTDLRFGDFDGDGKTDVFTASKEGGKYRWKYSSGGARSWKNLAIAGNPLNQLRFGDFNGDRKTDVFIAAWTGKTYQWKYSAGGATSWINMASAGNPIEQLRFGDFDGDRKTDVFTRGKYNNRWYWQYSSGGVTSWKRMAQAGEALEDLRVS